MNFWDKYTTDNEAQTNGIWHDFKGGLSLKIARADMDSNPVYAQKYQQIFSNIDQKDEAEITQAMINLYAQTIVTDAKVNGVEGYCNQDGKPVKFSVKFTAQLLQKLPELFKEIITVSNTMDNYLEVTVKAAQQLGKSLDGK